jgi:hypothetical protein
MSDGSDDGRQTINKKFYKEAVAAERTKLFTQVVVFTLISAMLSLSVFFVLVTDDGDDIP